MRETVLALVEAIEPLDHVEAQHRRAVTDWITSGAELCRTVKPATPRKHLVSYCVLIDSTRRQILLVDHRDAQLWLPAGGHVAPGETPVAAARREISEELGIDPAFHPAVGAVPLLITETPTAGLSTTHIDVSLWFVFAGSEQACLTPDPREFVDVRWWDFDEIRHRPGSRFDPHLPRFVEKIGQRL